MSRFLSETHPIITAMLDGENMESLVKRMKNTIEQGVEAFCILAQTLVPEEKTPESIRKIIETAKGRPIYITNYHRSNSQSELEDDVLAEQLLEMAKLGCDLIDVRADMFCRSEDEVTTNKDAVEKQKKLIDEIHKTGAEVLMSTHIFDYRTPEEILEIAHLQESRGVDVAKIVTVVENEKEAEDAFKTISLLKEKLNIPFLFLCNGSHCKRHRLLGPLLGSCMYLCVENEKPKEAQPTISEAKALLETVGKAEEEYTSED